MNRCSCERQGSYSGNTSNDTNLDWINVKKMINYKSEKDIII